MIFFDAAGTLFHVKGSVGEVYLHYARKYGYPFTLERLLEVNAAFKEALVEAPPPIFAVDQPEKLKRCERLWWFDIVHAVFYRVGMFEKFDDYFDEVFEAFGRGELWEVFPDTLGVLEQLKHDGFELGVISNFDTRFFGILRELGLMSYFDSITISSLAGSTKPSPKIFQYALDQHALDPEEAVHVGDSRTEDLEGAQMSKITGVLLDRGKKQQGSEENWMISSLHELQGVLSKL